MLLTAKRFKVLPVRTLKIRDLTLTIIRESLEISERAPKANALSLKLNGFSTQKLPSAATLNLTARRKERNICLGPEFQAFVNVQEEIDWAALMKLTPSLSNVQ
ncbi:hypothetical protein G7Y89_g7928 [Cudoniella acicularis]|uniref:Uncharacterized protein n=1 Tax=Cudoniella acicularis TaxID=354080 RepID=A0A8H4RJK8_9HELO|nr:hypothetical protein G7Y89_g7928 [Cudoniella acicularis]